LIAAAAAADDFPAFCVCGGCVNFNRNKKLLVIIETVKVNGKQLELGFCTRKQPSIV